MDLRSIPIQYCLSLCDNYVVRIISIPASVRAIKPFVMLHAINCPKTTKILRSSEAHTVDLLRQRNV